MAHPLPPSITHARPMRDSCSASPRIESRISSPDSEPRLRSQRLWQEYFADPSQWWDIRTNKTNSQAPDLRHRSTRESLWIDGCDNPSWVKDLFERKETEKRGGQRTYVGESSSGHAKEEQGRLYKASFMPRVHLDASETQQPLDGSGFNVLSLEEALDILDNTAELPSIENLICILQKCRKNKNLSYAKRVHSHICNNGLEAHRAVGNHIVPMFVDCGSVFDAQEVFDRLIHRKEHSWTALISGYVECGQSDHALNLYKKMLEDSVQPSSYTLMALLKACARLKDVKRGREIHAEIAQRGFERNVFVGNTLVDMYAKCGALSEAREVLDILPVRDVVSWNALMIGYAEHQLYWNVLKCFEQMQVECISPNTVTYVCVLKACSHGGAIEKGREIHAEIAQKGLERDLSVGNTLVDMYAKCGSLLQAREVFDNMPVRNVVSWTSLLAGYAEHGHGPEALICFEQMQLEGVSPDAVTYVCVLKACSNIGAIDKGRELHANLAEKGFEKNVFVGNTLVDMYVKCGLLAEAQEVFNKLPVRDVVSWTALIAGYVEHGVGQEALKCFEHMQLEGVSPNVVTFVCALKACGSIGAIDRGREIHADITQNGFERSLSVGNTLIDMYCKCGSLSEAREVFDKLSAPDVVSWSAMIQGYGMNHQGNMAVQCFENMQEQGMKPDDVTFTCLLSACSRARLVFKGHEFFHMMREEYCIAPTLDHYTCMVDLLAQSGHLYEAECFLECMPCSPSKEAWTALLNACKTYQEPDIGLRCFHQLVQMNPEGAAPYVLMSKIYASGGRWDDADRMEELRQCAGAKKKPASALIEVNKKVHEFVVGDNQNENIAAMIECLNLRMEEEGHVPMAKLNSRSIIDEEKEVAFGAHAEKWAIAFGLLNTPQGQTLRVTKNMRMCNDCHNTTKLISRIERREIIVRDIYHIHHFMDGLCSCDDMC